MKLSIIISTWNSLVFLKPCIESIRNLLLDNREIIIIDNSNDGTKQYIDSLSDPTIRYVWTEEKLDWSDANQIGLDLASGDMVCFSNPDILFNETFLDLLAYCYKYQTEVIAPQLIHPDGRNQGPQNLMSPYEILARTHTAEFLNKMIRRKAPSHTIQYSTEEPFFVKHPVGSLFIVSRRIIDQFHGRLWHRGYRIGVSDSDAFKNFAEQKVPIYLFPACRMIHFEGHRTKENPERTWVEYDVSYGIVLYFRYWQMLPRMMTALLFLESFSAFFIDLLVKTVKPNSSASPVRRAWRIGQRAKGLYDGWRFSI